MSTVEIRTGQQWGDNLESTCLRVKVTVYLASQRLDGGVAQLVCAAVPANIDERVKADGNGWGRGSDDARIEEHEEVADGDGNQDHP